MRENPLGGKAVMPMKRYKPEQIVTMLRQIEVGIANGKTTPQACNRANLRDVIALHRLRQLVQFAVDAVAFFVNLAANDGVTLPLPVVVFDNWEDGRPCSTARPERKRDPEWVP
jgi:hypothetical protein